MLDPPKKMLAASRRECTNDNAEKRRNESRIIQRFYPQISLGLEVQFCKQGLEGFFSDF